MLVDHVARFPNIYDFISGRNLLWFSAAEGFVTISGLLVGYIYAHKFLQQPKEIIKKLYKRALILYIAVISLAVAFMAYSSIVLYEGNFISDSGTPIGLVFQLLTLQYSYGWAEFLTHYVIFLLIAPLGLYLIAKKRSWIVLVASGLVWLAFLWSSEGQTRYEFTASWQFVFFIGMVVGAHLLSINAWVRNRFSKVTIRRSTYALWSLAAILFVTSSFFSYGATMISQNISSLHWLDAEVDKFWQPLNESFFSWWTDKATVAPLRILFGIIVFWALFTLFHRYAPEIHRFSNGLFLTLGKQPLFAYCFGAVVIFFTEKYFPSPSRSGLIFITNVITTSVVIFITYSFTKLFTRYITTKSIRSPEFKDSVN
jgi:hypothetical protein